MTDKQIKVGDVCGWIDVPDRGLARTKDGSVAYRNRGRGVFVAQPGEQWLGAQPWADEGKWRWCTMSLEETVTIIALDVPADATAEHLRALAERFEVREALYTMTRGDHAAESTLERFIKSAAAGPTFGDLLQAFDAAAKRLHAAGWRPGMTAKDAARLLAGAG